MKLAYCDMIAYAIKEMLNQHEFFTPNKVEYDLAEEGYLVSTTKTLTLADANGKMYKVTVEEI